MKCLCCGENLNSRQEEIIGWHNKCVKRFFGTSDLPKFVITKEKLEELANDTVNKRLVVPGVQKKLSLHLSKTPSARLTIVDYPTGYICKPQTKEYRHLPEYEHLSMLMAKKVGIKVALNALFKMDDEFIYLTKRVDRIINKEKVLKYAMEDFCQLSERQTIDKYKGSYEQCGKIIRKYSSCVGLDLSEFYIRVIYSFIIGNSDMHLKNFSLIENVPGGRLFHLSDSYDLLPVNLVLPEDEDQTALMLNGKKKNIRKKDMIALGENIGINNKTACKIIDSICSKEEELYKEIDNSFLDDDEKEEFCKLIGSRIKDMR